MTPERSKELDRRWQELHQQLEDLHAMRVTDDGGLLAKEDVIQKHLDAI